MNCSEFRRSVGAEPNIDAEALRAHAVECEACARYWREVQQMDGLIHRALKIDAPSSSVAHPAQRMRARYWAAAASFAAAIAAGSLLWIGEPAPSLAREVAQHARHEADALVSTAARVDEAQLAAVLEQSGVRLSPGAMHVSYAMSCAFRGREVPHLVVQTGEGPVTVLVLRRESVAEPIEFEEAGFRGVITPAPQGALAVLTRGAGVEDATQAVLQALEYL